MRDNNLGLVLTSYKRIDAAVDKLLQQLDQHKRATVRVHSRAAAQVPQVLAQILESSQRMGMGSGMKKAA